MQSYQQSAPNFPGGQPRTSQLLSKSVPHPEALHPDPSIVYSKSIKKHAYSTMHQQHSQKSNQKKNELTYSYSLEDIESLEGSFGGPAIAKYVQSCQIEIEQGPFY